MLTSSKDNNNGTLTSLGSRSHLWDYSRGNVAFLLSRGVRARYVPLGYAPTLNVNLSQTPTAHSGVEVSATIDVLFYGMMNEYRHKRITELRRAGLTVLHANAHSPAFGARLDRILMRTRLVLNLRFFDGEPEWKMTRFIKPLANGQWVPCMRVWVDGAVGLRGRCERICVRMSGIF